MRGRKEAVYFTGIYMTYDLLVGALNKAGLPNLSSQYHLHIFPDASNTIIYDHLMLGVPSAGKNNVYASIFF